VAMAGAFERNKKPNIWEGCFAIQQGVWSNWDWSMRFKNPVLWKDTGIVLDKWKRNATLLLVGIEALDGLEGRGLGFPGPTSWTTACG